MTVIVTVVVAVIVVAVLNAVVDVRRSERWACVCACRRVHVLV